MTLRSSSFKNIDIDIMTNSIRSHSPRNNGRKNSINLTNCEPVRVMLETTSSFKNLVQDIRKSESDYLGVQANGCGSEIRHKSVPRIKLPEPAIFFSPRPISELDSAAVKLQKVYKSYRTRRNLADCAVVVEELWWKALDSVALKRSSVSYFKVEEPETAISRWSRARTRAAKVGKGLSKCEKAQKLALQHWLEAIDPRHRYGHNLHMYYDIWFDSESSQPFFYWLDVGDGKEVNIEKCPRSSLQRQCIQYLGPIERETYEVIIGGGKLLYRQSGLFVNTIEGSKWIFVLSTSRKLYVGQKKKGVFQHSSFLSGGATVAAGRLVAHGGVLEAIWPYSGHYLPTEENFREFISFLEEHHVDLANVKRCVTDDDYLSSNIGDRESMSKSAITTTQPEDKIESDVNVPTMKTDADDLEEPIFSMTRRLSCKWTSGAGPRIGCVRDYPTELQFQALEQVNLSPGVASGPAYGNYGPIPSPRPSPKIERETYEVIVEGGKLLYRQSGLFVDTIEGSKWIFVLSTSRKLYVGQKKKGVFQHSSFLSGGATVAAGRLVAHGGVLEAIWPYSGHYLPTEENFREFISFLEEHHVDLANVKRCATDDDYLSSNIGDRESMSKSAITTTQPKDKIESDVNVPTKKTDADDLEEPIFSMARRLSYKWTSGAGPRIGCVRDYPTKLQFQALEQVNLSPRVASGPAYGNYGPIPSPRPSPKVRLSPGISYMGLPSPRTPIASN